MPKLIHSEMYFDDNVSVAMRDGCVLRVNVFRPASIQSAPVLMSVTPYGKDKMPDRMGMLLMRLSGVRFGNLDCSKWTGFEAPDPTFWVQQGYAIVQADIRGMHKSDGRAGVLTRADADDYFELIEWAARQSWSTGLVGLLGVSYLAMSQWRVAALQPPALRAICPWEGVTDLLREFGYQDGIPETGFTGIWWKYRMQRGRNKRLPMAENFPGDRDDHPFDDAYWEAKRPVLEDIHVPALVCASWSDQGLHTRGSFEGFDRIASTQKWLYTHGRRKWETFYSEDARATQLKFFDRFLKGKQNGWDDTPRVRLEVRHSLNQYKVRFEQHWPLQDVLHIPFYLDARSFGVASVLPTESATAHYDPNALGSRGRISFRHRFAHAAQIVGSMSLTLWISATDGDDMDLFILLRKFDALGSEVFFYGYNGFAKDGVAKGWLRASHRALDVGKSRPDRPWHSHLERQPIRPREVTRVEIEILPSATLFEPDSFLQIDILGRDAANYPAFKHARTVNRGVHSVLTGIDYPSMLLVPLVQRIR